MLADRVEKHLKSKRDGQLYRHLKATKLHSPIWIESLHDGRCYHHFSSSDYLGLSFDPHIMRQASQALYEYGLSSCSSAYIAGYHELIQQLESALADWLGFEDVMVCASAFMANLSWMTALIQRTDHVWIDRQCHASLWQGLQGFRGKIHRFRQTLEYQEVNHDFDCALHWLVSDGVFSMSGQTADLQALLQSMRDQNHVSIVVDDAHGIGVMGHHGRGIIGLEQHQNIDVDILIGGFGKTFASYGGFIAGCHDTIAMIRQYAKTAIYTTALPPVVLAATYATCQRIMNGDDLRTQLYDRIAFFKSQADRLGLVFKPSDHPIQYLRCQDISQAIRIEKQLIEMGYWVRAMRPPTVDPSEAGLRFTVNRLHTQSCISEMLKVVAQCLD